jgi:hypothetical protein
LDLQSKDDILERRPRFFFLTSKDDILKRRNKLFYFKRSFHLGVNRESGLNSDLTGASRRWDNAEVVASDELCPRGDVNDGLGIEAALAATRPNGNLSTPCQKKAVSKIETKN